MTEAEIIAEIRRIAEENGGKAPGRKRFEKLTGIKESEWWGKYWRSWGAALRDAGFSENSLAQAYPKDFLISSLAELTRRLGRFPAEIDLRIERRHNKAFPSQGAFQGIGSRNERILAVREYATHSDYSDILPLLPASVEEENPEEAMIPSSLGKVVSTWLSYG